MQVPAGEKGYSALEQIWARPTAEVNGIVGGYIGEGAKTVIPAKASAKVSFRLVGDQDPEAIRAQLPRLRRGAPAGRTARRLSSAMAATAAISQPSDSPWVKKAQRALTEEWGRQAVLIAMGGSIPIVTQFKRILGMDSRADRLRPGRRPHPFAEREIQSDELSRRHPLLGAGARGARGVERMHLAQMNVGTTLYDTDDPRMADFMDNLDRMNALAEATPGFVWRLTGEGNNATDIRPADDPRFIVNMSVWGAIEALFDYVYRSDHRAVMVRRREWFAKPEGPYHVLWWVGEGHRRRSKRASRGSAISPTHGPTPYAFTFRERFPENAAAPVDLKPEPYCVGWA